MTSTSSPLRSMQTQEQFDGSQWRQYLSDESYILLTSVGRRLFAQKGVASLLHRYFEEATSASAPRPVVRIPLADGSNSRVFSVGEARLAVKEALPDRAALLPAMHRMDRLKHAVETHCPRWIDVPKHYGALSSLRDFNRQYLLMEKIDSGVTVDDILLGPRSPSLAQAVDQTFGPVTPELQREVRDRFDELRGSLRGALLGEYMSPDEYLPDLDYNPHNVLVERLTTPVAGNFIKYWVIDQ